MHSLGYHMQNPLSDSSGSEDLNLKLPWEGVYNATSKPPPCWQLDDSFIEDFPVNHSDVSEDCLYLNVWRRALKCPVKNNCDRKRLVVVFIEGSAFQWGDSAFKSFPFRSGVFYIQL
ncbi:unnamed protein product [Ixodes pacificus]